MHANLLRVVLDTNVLLSALVFGGKPRQVVELMACGLIEVVLSEEIFTELRRKTTAKFPDFLEELHCMELLLENDAKIVKLGGITIAICRDPNDNDILETAVMGDCQYIVSGGKDLLSLGKYKDIAIVKPAEFMKIFG